MSIHLSSKLALVSSPGSEDGHILAHWCPGCKGRHLFNIEKPNSYKAVWSWNGDVEKPTFQPSMNIVGRCHYILSEGRITFLSDCNHELAGKTVDLPNYP